MDPLKVKLAPEIEGLLGDCLGRAMRITDLLTLEKPEKEQLKKQLNEHPKPKK